MSGLEREKGGFLVLGNLKGPKTEVSEADVGRDSATIGSVSSDPSRERTAERVSPQQGLRRHGATELGRVSAPRIENTVAPREEQGGRSPMPLQHGSRQNAGTAVHRREPGGRKSSDNARRPHSIRGGGHLALVDGRIHINPEKNLGYRCTD